MIIFVLFVSEKTCLKKPHLNVKVQGAALGVAVGECFIDVNTSHDQVCSITQF